MPVPHDAHGVPFGVALEPRERKCRYRRRQTSLAQLVAKLTELTGCRQTNVNGTKASNDPVEDVADAEVQFDPVEVPPLKRSRLVKVVTVVQNLCQGLTADVHRVLDHQGRPVDLFVSTTPVQQPVASTTGCRLRQFLNSSVTPMVTCPIRRNNPQRSRSMCLNHNKTVAVDAYPLPELNPVDVLLSPTRYMEAPDIITNDEGVCRQVMRRG